MIAKVTKKYWITQIVIAESQRTSFGGPLLTHWQILFKESLTQNLVRLLKNIDLHIIGSEKIVSFKEGIKFPQKPQK